MSSQGKGKLTKHRLGYWSILRLPLIFPILQLLTMVGRIGRRIKTISLPSPSNPLVLRFSPLLQLPCLYQGINSPYWPSQRISRISLSWRGRMIDWKITPTNFYIIPLPKVSAAFRSDNTGPNAKARRIPFPRKSSRRISTVRRAPTLAYLW